MKVKLFPKNNIINSRVWDRSPHLQNAQKCSNVTPPSQNSIYKDHGKRLPFMIFYIQLHSPLGVLILGYYQYLL